VNSKEIVTLYQAWPRNTFLHHPTATCDCPILWYSHDTSNTNYSRLYHVQNVWPLQSRD